MAGLVLVLAMNPLLAAGAAHATAAAAAHPAAHATAAAAGSIKPGQNWTDTSGNLIDAHGAGLLEHAGKYYWYGSRRTLGAPGTQNDGGIALYSSSDLYAWTFESVVVPVFNCSSNNSRPEQPEQQQQQQQQQPDGERGLSGSGYPPPSCANGNGLDLERPKVVQCGGAGGGGKFVMWVRGTGYGNTPQLLAVLESDSPTGPFVFVSNATGSDDPFKTVAAGIKNYPPGCECWHFLSICVCAVCVILL